MLEAPAWLCSSSLLPCCCCCCYQPQQISCSEPVSGQIYGSALPPSHPKLQPQQKEALPLFEDGRQQEFSSAAQLDSLTVIVQGKVVLGIAELLRAASDEDVVVSEEILEAGDLRRRDNMKVETNHRLFWLKVQCVTFLRFSRRNSDIEWLHFRLQRSFTCTVPPPGAVPPPTPLSLPVNYGGLQAPKPGSLLQLLLHWFILERLAFS